MPFEVLSKVFVPLAQRDPPSAPRWYRTNFQGPHSVLLQKQASLRYASSSLTSGSGADRLLPPLSQFFLHNIG